MKLSKNKKTFFSNSKSRFLSIRLLSVLCFVAIAFINMNAQNTQSKNITGKVTDVLKEPLIGVTVRLAGTSVANVTDISGNYSIRAAQGDILEFSYIGMKTKQVKLGTSAIVDVEMEDDAISLEETIVIGYGTAKKRDLTGSIVSIGGSIVADKPSSNPLASLQGRVSGVQVVNTGRAGQDPEIRIRGTNSINGYAPLYIVDGLFTDNINHLNAADIESIEILKDASSLAIFGIRGANGVIIISTKRAKEGQMQINVNSSLGIKTIADRLPMANATQFKELYNEQRINQGASPFDYTRWNGDTNWQDELFQTAIVNQNNISITSATEKNKLYISLGYATEQGNIKTEEMKKLTVNLNSETKVKDYLKVGFQVNGSRTQTPDAKNVNGVLKAAPIAPVHFDYLNPITGETERLLHTMPDFQRSQSSNPVRDIELLGQHNLGVNHRLQGNMFGELNFLKHFTFRTTYSLNYTIEEARDFSPIIWEYNPDAAGDDKKVHVNDRETINQNKNTGLSFQQDYVLTYEKRFGKHALTATLGLTSNYRESSKLKGSRYQLLNDIYFSPEGNQDKWWLSAIESTIGAGNSSEQWKRFNLSYLARALYNYDNRYLLNMSYRRDGSSVFSGVGNTWDNFYSIGGGWIVSGENFMQENNLIDYLKIKASYGVLGSENTGDKNYPTYPLLTSSGSAVFGDEIIPGYTLQYMVQNLHWEKTHSTEAGFEIRLLKNRLSLEPVYYSKLTKDIIVSLASRTGARNSLENLGEISNKGLEISASWNDKIGTNFRYSIGANLTTIKNNVVSIGRDAADARYEKESRSRTTSGYPIAHFYGYVVEGVYQTWTDIKQSPQNTLAGVRPGDLKFKDVDGDGKITDKDRTMIGNPTPDCMYGFNIGAGYKNFDLSIDLMGVYGNEIYRDWGTSTYAQLNYQERNMNRWHGKGTSNWEPILDPSRAINTMSSSYFIEDGSFFRIRNVQLSYTFGKELLNRIHFASLRIFANAQNLKTWHKNSGYTPEVGGTALAFGMDSGGYPMPCVYTLGINISF